MTMYYVLPSLSTFNKKQLQAFNRLTRDGVLQPVMKGAWDKTEQEQVPYVYDGPLTGDQVRRLTEKDMFQQLDRHQRSFDGLHDILASIRKELRKARVAIDDNTKGYTLANRYRVKEITDLQDAVRALEDASESTEPGDRCRYCGQEVQRAGLSNEWYHSAGNQVTVPHVARP
jgi:hypothetical protein